MDAPTRDGARPGLVLLGPTADDVRAGLAEAGFAVAGVLGADPFSPVPDAVRYRGLLEVLAAAEAGAVVAAVVAPALAAALPDLVAAGLPVVLAEPGPWDADLLSEVRAEAVEHDVPVAALLRTRHSGWVRAADRELTGDAPEPPRPVQVLVQGWPAGEPAAAELLDLLRRWCGDVVAVAADPQVLPATSLPDGVPVDWALLAEEGTTVLVATGGGAPQVRLSFADRRLTAGPEHVGWTDGRARAGAPWPPLPEQDAAATAFAALAGALRTGDAGLLGSSFGGWPWPADLYDALPVARVLRALRAASSSPTWVELG